MIRVVIDTNVVVSANLIDEGPSAAILDLVAKKRILMFVSAPVMAEYEEVLNRPRLKLASVRINDALAVIRDTAKSVQPTRIIDEIKDEPECADAVPSISSPATHPTSHRGSRT
jgi:putative PIN family toxin of toxin-antitoxin system